MCVERNEVEWVIEWKRCEEYSGLKMLRLRA